jgi:hypothetical protein
MIKLKQCESNQEYFFNMLNNCALKTINHKWHKKKELEIKKLLSVMKAFIKKSIRLQFAMCIGFTFAIETKLPAKDPGQFF